MNLNDHINMSIRGGLLAALALGILHPGWGRAQRPVVDLQIQPATGQVQVDWIDSAPNDGYALHTSPELETGAWPYAGTPDTWPTGRMNWSGDLVGANSVFRIEKTDRGRLVAAEAQASYGAFTIGLLLWLQGINFISPSHGVDVYRLTYETFDHRGRSTLASGALCVPTGTTQAPVVSYQHATIFEQLAAPSNDGATEQFVGIALAAEGYLAVMPDYLGLGTNSPPLHPFVHARSEAVAAVDMLRVGLAYARDTLNLQSNGQLFLVGYSQGGHATLALQQELEHAHATEFPITASAPMAGPHDLSGTMTDLLLSSDPYGAPSYLAYLLFGHNEVYDFFEDPAEILVEPYPLTLPPLLDGMHTSDEIDAAMPAVPRDIFTAEFLADFEANSNNVFRTALRVNNTFGWTPTARTRFYHCAGDTVVPKSNSWVAYSNFVSRGAADVSLVDPSPGSDHTEGAMPCFEAAKNWFDTMKLP